MVRDLNVLLDGLILRNIPNIKAQQQIFNISNTLRFIEDIKQTLPSELEEYSGWGVEEQELKEFFDNAKVGKFLDETRYEGIITQLRTVLVDLQQKQREYISVQPGDGGESENEKDVESEQDESEEDAEIFQLRDIIAKLSANVRSSTRHISRAERDLISKSLLNYIKMKKKTGTPSSC